MQFNLDSCSLRLTPCFPQLLPVSFSSISAFEPGSAFPISFFPQGLSWGLCIKGLGYQDVLAGMDSRLQVMNGAVSWRLVVQARWGKGRQGGTGREERIHISAVTLASLLGRVLGWGHSLCPFFPAWGWGLALPHSSLSFSQELPLRLGPTISCGR